MIFPTHVMAPGRVASLFKRPSADAEFNMPGLHCSMSHSKYYATVHLKAKKVNNTRCNVNAPEMYRLYRLIHVKKDKL
jgi:hypothetical protein